MPPIFSKQKSRETQRRTCPNLLPQSVTLARLTDYEMESRGQGRYNNKNMKIVFCACLCENGSIYIKSRRRWFSALPIHIAGYPASFLRYFVCHVTQLSFTQYCNVIESLYFFGEVIPYAAS